MNVSKPFATVLLASGLLIGGLGAGTLMTPSLQTAHAASVTPQQTVAPETDQLQEPSYTGSVPVDEAATQGVSEADEAAALAGSATISAAEAEAAVLAAHPGASVHKTELENENGYLVYSVALDTGMDVKVDAGNGTILATEQDDGGDLEEADETAGEEADASDTDDVEDEQDDGDEEDVQEEHEDQADDATGAAEVEGAVGQ